MKVTTCLHGGKMGDQVNYSRRRLKTYVVQTFFRSEREVTPEDITVLRHGDAFVPMPTLDYFAFDVLNAHHAKFLFDHFGIETHIDGDRRMFVLVKADIN